MLDIYGISIFLAFLPQCIIYFIYFLIRLKISISKLNPMEFFTALLNKFFKKIPFSWIQWTGKWRQQPEYFSYFLLKLINYCFFCRNLYRVIQQNNNQDLYKRTLSPVPSAASEVLDNSFVVSKGGHTRRASELSVSVLGLHQRRKSEFLLPIEPPLSPITF